MPNRREIRTCSRCRRLKLRCDRARPSCQRCTEAVVSCSFRAASSTPPASDGLSTPATETTDGSIPLSGVEEPLPPDDANGHSEGHDEASVVKEPKTVRRRQRAHLSCTRCFRVKVKCDKELPCSRCRLSGWGNRCAYNHRLESNNTLSLATNPQEPVETEHDTERNINSWHAQRRGATHWEELLSHVSILDRSIRGKDRADCSRSLSCRLAVPTSWSAPRKPRTNGRGKTCRLVILCFPATSHSTVWQLPDLLPSKPSAICLGVMAKCVSRILMAIWPSTKRSTPSSMSFPFAAWFKNA